MTDDHKFPDELAWRDDGHASDEVVTALADGQRRVVPLEAYAHVQSCRLCGDRLGRAAMVASAVDAALVPEACPAEAPDAAVALASAAAVRQAEAALVPGEPVELNGPASGRRLPLPLPALTAALVLAGVGAAPTLADWAPQLPALAGSLAAKATVLVHTLTVALRTLMASDSAAVTVAWTGAGLVLLMVGVLITRLLPLQINGENHE